MTNDEISYICLPHWIEYRLEDGTLMRIGLSKKPTHQFLKNFGDFVDSVEHSLIVSTPFENDQEVA